jgi:hypothetical protein
LNSVTNDLVVDDHKYTNVLSLGYFLVLWHNGNQGGCLCQERVLIV